MSAANQLTPLMSVAEFLNWNPPPGTDPDRWELREGHPAAMAPSSPRHGTIAAETAYLLRRHLDGHPHCRVVIEPGVQPRVRAAHNVRIPDLGVTCTPIGADDRLMREPVVLIEILSPSNPKDTWANVWAYTTIPSVRDILVLHSMTLRAELLVRQPDGSWPADPLVLLVAAADSVPLASIGFTLPLADFYRTVSL
jgi:Uma2 family endonuclease